MFFYLKRKKIRNLGRFEKWLFPSLFSADPEQGEEIIQGIQLIPAVVLHLITPLSGLVNISKYFVDDQLNEIGDYCI